MNKSFEAILKLLGQGLAYNKYYKIKIRTYKHTYTETFILSNWMVNCVNSAQESLCLIIFLCLSCTPASPRHPGTVAHSRLSVNACCMTGHP